MKPLQAARERGFTLIELLVAITILALVAVFSWAGLDQVTRTRDALVQNQAVLDASQRLFARLARDVSQTRGVRADASGRLIFALATAPGALAPAEVEYGLSEDRLVRRDPGGVGDEVLFDHGVLAWRAEVRHDDGSWGASLDRTKAPAGLRVTVRLAEVGELRRVFLLRE